MQHTTVWMNMNEYEYEWIWMNTNMNEYEYEWIWIRMNMNTNMNEYEWIWIWMVMNKNECEYGWIWMILLGIDLICLICHCIVMTVVSCDVSVLFFGNYKSIQIEKEKSEKQLKKNVKNMQKVRLNALYTCLHTFDLLWN